MLDARNIIERAAREIRIIDLTDGLDRNIYSEHLEALNSMLRSWGASLAL